MKRNRTLLLIGLLLSGIVLGYSQQCAAPSDLSATNITETTATLTWAGHADHKSFDVDVMHGAQTSSFKWNTSTTGTSVDVTGLEPGSLYRFKVQASCDKGKGNSGWTEFTTAGEKTNGPGQGGDNGNNSPGPCAKVTNLAVRDVTDSTVVLTWRKDTTHVSYRLDVKSKNQTPQFNESFDLTDSFKVIKGLAPGGNYHFRVKADCAKNSSGSSAWIDFSTTGGDSSFQQCPKPKNLSILEVTDSSALLSWIIQDSIKSFFLEIRNGNGTPTYYKAVTLEDTFYLAKNLTAEGNYRFRVKATCIDGSTSGSSDWAPFSTNSAEEDSEEESGIDDPINEGVEGEENIQQNNATRFASISVFPNPVDQDLNMALPESQPSGQTLIVISDFGGKVVYSKLETDPKVRTMRIPVHEFKNGYYQVTMQTGTAIAQQKFFIHHPQ